MAYDFTLSDIIPATPQEVYDAWLDSEEHAAMTGGDAEASDEVGDEFEAHGGYITGENLELEPPRRIVQSWRTSEFTDAHEDSRIEVILEPVPEGTRLTLRHTNVPDGQTGYEKHGWRDHYFLPMKAYFSSR